MPPTTADPPPGRAPDPAEALTSRLRQASLAALELYTVYLGERLGLYRSLAEGGPATSAELADRTGTVERYVREWLEHHAASGRSPQRSSGTAITAAWPTSGWPMRAFSSSTLEIHSPPDLTRSLVRSTRCR
jgi:hypothetical protein